VQVSDGRDLVSSLATSTVDKISTDVEVQPRDLTDPETRAELEVSRDAPELWVFGRNEAEDPNFHSLLWRDQEHREAAQKRERELEEARKEYKALRLAEKDKVRMTLDELEAARKQCRAPEASSSCQV